MSRLLWGDETDVVCPRCGRQMDVEEGLLVDVVRCPHDRAEGVRGPEHRLLDRVRRWRGERP